MPFSYAQYAGNGSTPTLSVPFPYLLKAHVKLYTGYDILDGTFATQLADGVGFNWVSGTQVQLTGPLATGVQLTIKRETPDASQAVTWQDGSNLISDDQNTADLQNLYVVQEQQDRVEATAILQKQASADAAAALAGVNNALPYGPVGTVAAIPASAANGARIEVANSAGIETFSPLTGRPAGFIGSAQIKVRLVYAASGSTWQWVDYAVADPDGRYVRQASISSSTTSASTTTVANSLAVKTAADAAASAQAAADGARDDADAALPKAGGTMTGPITFDATQPTATTTTAGIVQLSNNISSSSETRGASSKAVKDAKEEAVGTAAPPGTIQFFAGVTPPTGWLKANGALVSRTTYAALFAAISTSFGAGDGSTTFPLPDLRGEFLRGWDDGRGVDSGRARASAQSATGIYGEASTDLGFGNSLYDISTTVGINGDSTISTSGSGATQIVPNSTVAVGAWYRTGITVRPRNIALLAIIKF